MSQNYEALNINHLPKLPGNSFENSFKRSYNKNQLFVRSSMGSMGI